MTYIYESKHRKTTIIYDKDYGLSLDIEKTFQSPLPLKHPSSSNKSTSDKFSPDKNVYCCACLELVGGKLYTCSRCSSSFHAICHFPPLPIKKTDRLQWLCHRCKIELKHNFDQPVKPILDPQLKEDNHNLVIIRLLLNETKTNDDSHLQDFATALKAINAREFSLDKFGIEDYYYKLPFDELFNTDNQNQTRKPCHFCKRSFDKQMINCDYCTAIFCLDCLNPPITTLPNERFMCPLHIERFADLYLVNSLRVTERMARWKEHAIKISSPSESLLIFMEFYKKSNKEKQESNQIGLNDDLTRNEHYRYNKKMRVDRQTTFKVNELVKNAYAAIFAENSKCIISPPSTSLPSNDGQLEKQVITSKDNVCPINHSSAVEILLDMRNKHNTSTDEHNPLNFYPKIFDIRSPVFAALSIISGMDKKPTLTKEYMIPIQSEFLTLGVFRHKHSIDLSEFSSCKALIKQQALIFFDKSKCIFEMVSANLFMNDGDALTSNMLGNNNLCKCIVQSNNPLGQLDVSQGITPSNRPSVLWNGSVIRIGCLQLLFVGLGTF